jgi:hypothetical protein
VRRDLTRCPVCLKRIKMLRPLGNYEHLTAFEGPAHLDAEQLPDDLHVESVVPYVAEPVRPGTMRARGDGTEGPYILPHKPRCTGGPR